MTRDLKTSPLRAAALLIVVLGVFLSFSRAAWGLFLLGVVLLIFLMLLKERSGVFRLRILILSLLATVLMVAALLIALQFPQVSDLFSTRAQLVQEYDGEYLGRFDRHRIGFQMMMERPLGLGPMVFGTIFPEDEHNIWLKTLTTYGWLGFVSYVSLLVWTLYLGLKNLAQESALAALSDDRLDLHHRPRGHRQRDRHRPLAACLSSLRHRLGVRSTRTSLPAEFPGHSAA